MANTWYAMGRQLKGTNGLHWVNDTIYLVLLDLADYTPNIDTHQYLSSIPAAARIHTAEVVNKTLTNGIADADDTELLNVSGDPGEAIAGYKWVTADADSPLLLYWDTGTGLPVEPNGGSIIVRWSNTAFKISRL